MKYIKLPRLLEPKSRSGVIRLGRSNDGGYVVCRDAIKNSSCLLSLGINDDWSFEEAYRKQVNKPIIAYDGSISEKLFRQRFYKCLLSGYQIKNAVRFFRIWMNFRKFIRESMFYEQFIGITDFENYVSLSDVLTDLGIAEGIFLKIDIEGYEYRILDDIIDNKSCFVGVAIEFHDVDLHIEKIKTFVQEFGQEIISINVNNYSPVTASGTPLTMEIGFSSVRDHVQETHWSELIQPNNPIGYKYNIVFQD